MTLPFNVEDIVARPGFFSLDGCYGIHVTKPRTLIASLTETESFENPLFTIHQLSFQGMLQAYVIEPFYSRYITRHNNVLVMRRTKGVKTITSQVSVRYSLGPLSVIVDEDSSIAIFCVDTSSRPVT